MFFKVMASSPIGSFRHQSTCREARLGDTDWFNKASAINRLTASRVEASYLSRQDRTTSGSTSAQAAAAISEDHQSRVQAGEKTTEPSARRMAAADRASESRAFGLAQVVRRKRIEDRAAA
jgi:hypothetical protein